MIRIGFVFGELNQTGSTWNYMTTLTQKINKYNDFQAVGLYYKGDPDDFDIDIQFSKYKKRNIPKWDEKVVDENLDLIHRDGQPLFNHIPAIRSSVPVVTTIHGSWNCPSWNEQKRLAERGVSKWQFEVYKAAERLSRVSYDRLLAVSDQLPQA